MERFGVPGRQRRGMGMDWWRWMYRATFESTVRCETVMDDSKRSDTDSQDLRQGMVSAIIHPLTKWEVVQGKKEVHESLMKCAVNGLRM